MSLVSEFIINPVLRQARRFSSGFAADDSDRPAVAPYYAAFGHALGSAFCLAKDCRNLLDGAASTDLGNGTRTYPIVLHMSGLRSIESRQVFAELLREARHNPEKRKQVVAEMLAAGTFNVASLVIDTSRRKALKALEDAGPLEPAATALRDLCNFAKQAAA